MYAVTQSNFRWINALNEKIPGENIYTGVLPDYDPTTQRIEWVMGDDGVVEPVVIDGE